MTGITERKWAQAESNSDFICVETYSGYRSSALDPEGKQHLLAPDASDELLGLAVQDSLSHSRFLPVEAVPAFFGYRAVAHRYVEWVKALMERYGYKTKRALFKNMKTCGIECCSGVITIRPTNHEKLEGWSGEGISKDDFVIVPEDNPPAVIGAALRLAFSRCIG